MRVGEASYFASTLEAATLIPSNGCVSNSHVAADAGLSSSKMDHRFQICYAQDSQVTAKAESHIIHVMHGLTGSILGFKAGVKIACTGTGAIDVDLLKNGASILTAAIALTSADLAYVPDDGVIATAAGVLDDVFEIVITPKGPDIGDLEYIEHFIDDAGATLPTLWGVDAETANSVEDYVADQPNGQYTIQNDATSEAQSTQLFCADNLWIDLFEKPIIEWRCKLDLTGTNALGSADQRLVIGVSSVHANAEDSLDAVVTNAWFRMEGTSANIYVEADDGTLNTDDQDSGIDLVDNTWHHFKIDFSNLADVKFHINGVEQSGAVVSMANIAASTVVQPIVCLQRDLDVEAEKIYIDSFKVTSGLEAGTLGKGVFASVTLSEDAAV